MLDQRSRPPSFSILRRFLQLPLVPWTEKTSELCPFPSTSPGQPRRMPVALDKRAVAGSRNHVQLHSCTFLVEDKPRKIIRLYAFGYMLQLGKSWACKHWKFQNNYFVIFCIFVAFFLHLGLSFWICVVIFCHVFVISLSFLCHFFVICLSFYCHFIVILGTGKWRKTNVKK